ncbi:MAG TPA: Ku protein [Salinisphaeraceae bacterium]|nr:Ku protein [Salinisphaeraceae bacterium]
MPEEKADQACPDPRPFWSGSIAFGLINLPVSLYAAYRRHRVALRMVDEDGTLLRRRYYCPHDEQELTAAEIIRGYAVAEETFVMVEDEELDAVAPEQAREIDLRRFVPAADIDPMYFERAYFLTPGEGAVKAYRLLAQSMQYEQRAGIATVVMRGTAHLIAIIAEHGILRAETLRFHDELRSPEDIGLPALEQGERARVQAFRKSIRSRSRKTLPRRLLADRYDAAMRERIDYKLRHDEDVIHAPTESAEAEDARDDDEIDLMQVLRDSLQQKETATGQGRSGGDGHEKSRAASGRKHDGDGKRNQASLERLTKSELYRRARKLDVSGRSSMTKAELAKAISGTTDKRH